ncbi:MAG: ANTAR domain-containing protein [Mycobacteriaceae bacterium]|nr:ANTAR domain-containing protein [Mycobacteriaceae bacterium]MBV9638668.1 ANTAR domain-containing protein [Mycobacteriaceae bacterium]
MNDRHNEPTSTDGGQAVQALGDGTLPGRLGWFRYYFDEERWEWSDEVAKMHGYLPGSVTPTTRLVLSHKHPDDYQHIAQTLERIRHTRQPFSSRHRICDVAGHVHHVVVVADLLTDDGESVVGTYGFYIDVTPGERARQDEMTVQLAKITENRADIEQAKGMVRAIYGVDDHTAFETLRWRSQETNVKLRRLAQQVVADFTAAAENLMHPQRTVYDNLLLTAHLRIPPESPVQQGDQAV